MKKIICLLCFLLYSCSNTVPYDMKIKASDKKVFNIPEGCDHLYETSQKVIAVAPFQNNSSLQEGDYEFGQAAASINFGGASAVYSNVKEELTPQLSEFAQSAVESALAETGGAKIVSRAQLDQLLNEQTFQMTLADPDTVVELGLLTGAEYIVTGSVNKVSFRYRTGLETGYNSSDIVGLLLSLGSSVYNAVSAGWYVDTQLSVNVIDVSTGQIIASHNSEGSAYIGDGQFTTTSALGGAQAAMASGMITTVNFINDEFKMLVYVNELRGGGKMLLINRGRTSGISSGDIFSLQELHIRKDFRSGLSDCETMDTKDLYVVTEFVGDDYAWLEEKSGLFSTNKAHLGSLLRRVQINDK